MVFARLRHGEYHYADKNIDANGAAKMPWNNQGNNQGGNQGGGPWGSGGNNGSPWGGGSGRPPGRPNPPGDSIKCSVIFAISLAAVYQAVAINEIHLVATGGGLGLWVATGFYRG